MFPDLISEGVADGQMEGQQAIFDSGDVEITAIASVIGGVNAYTQVGAHHEHRHVETQTHASTHRQLVEEILHLQLSARA